jgi:hypothetical protein
VVDIWLANIFFPSTIKEFTLIFCAIQMHEGVLYLGVDAWQSPNGYNIEEILTEDVENFLRRIFLGAKKMNFVGLTQGSGKE